MPAELDRLLFVGSIPLPSARMYSGQFSRSRPVPKAMPDGETGERTLWIKFQQKMLSEHPAMERDPSQPPLPVKQSDGTVLRHIQLVRLKPDADPDRLNSTPAMTAPLWRHIELSGLRARTGSVPRHSPSNRTPDADGDRPDVLSSVGRDRYLHVYERALLNALRNILNIIPHADLSIQFDVCQEVLLFENYFPAREPDYAAPVFSNLSDLARRCPRRRLGFHLCYGSPGDQPLSP